MSSSVFDRAARTFLEARRLAGEERDEFLRRACADDAALREEVERLLVGDAAPASFETLGDELRPAVEELFASPPDAAPRMPERIGRYRVVRVIGEGGMGIVYEAEQESPRRRVALKVLRRQYGSARAIGRFRREAEILGRLQHPGIAQILEAGTTGAGGSEQPFIAMEYVQGRALLDYVGERDPGRRERLELVAMVCDAVHSAHQSGVVHRDLKPSNILVVETGAPGRPASGAGGAPPAAGVAVKVLDFGVARLTDSDVQAVTLHTTPGELIGTIPYMSPEQAAGDPENLDWRSDVYTLGVILYELLTGRLPQDVRTMLVHEAVRAIREDDPTPAGSVDRSLRGDIETIIAKALEKDKARRYQSAAELAADIRRHLSEQPIAARPASAVYRLRKFARRNKAVVTGVGVAFASMLVVTVMAVRQAIVTEAARRQEQTLRTVADARTAEAEWQAYRASLVAASSALRYHEVADAERHLGTAPEHLRGWEWRHLASRVDHSLLVLDTRFLPIEMAVSDDGSLVAACNSGGAIAVWSSAQLFDAGGHTGQAQPLATMQLKGNVQQRRVHSFHFSSGTGGEHILRADTEGGSVRLALDLAPTTIEARPSGGGVLTLLGSDGEARFRRSHDGRIGVRMEGAGESEGLVVREIATGAGLLRLPRHEFTPAFSPDDRLLALALDDGLGQGPGLFVYELDATRGPEASESPVGGASLVFHRPDIVGVSGIAFSRDGARAAIASSSTATPLSIIDVSSGRDLLALSDHGGGRAAISAVAFSPDDSLLATGSADGSVRVWRTSDGALLSAMHGHRGAITALEFVAGGPTGRGAVVSCATDRTIRWWDASGETDPFVLPAPATPYGLAFSPDGARLAAACLGGEKPLLVWDARTCRQIFSALDGYGSALAFSTDGAWLAMGRSHGDTTIVNAYDGAPRSSIPPAGWRTDWMQFGETDELMWLGNNGALSAHDTGTGERIKYAKVPAGDEQHGSRAASSPDGSLLLVASRRNIHVLDGRSWEVLGVLQGHEGSVFSVAFSPDGTRFVSGSADGTLRVWDVERREEIATLRGHSGAVFAAVYSPDGARIASGGRDRVVRIWDSQRFEEVTQLHGHTSLVYSLAFSPDGGTLVSGGGDHTVRVWGVEPYRSRIVRAE